MITGSRYIGGLHWEEGFLPGCTNPVTRAISTVPGTPSNVSGAPGPQTISLAFGATNLGIYNPWVALIFCPSVVLSGPWAPLERLVDDEGMGGGFMNLTNMGDDKTFLIGSNSISEISGETITFPNGFWKHSFTADTWYDYYPAIELGEDYTYTYWFYIQFTAYDLVTDFPGTPPASMRAPTKPIVSQSGGVGPFTITWTSQSDSAVDEIGFVIKRSLNGAAYVSVGSVPSDAALFPNYSYTDLPEENGEYEYIVQAYKYEPENTLGPESEESDEEEFDDEPEVVPDILVGFSTGGIIFSGRAKLVGDFHLLHTPTGGINFGNSTADNIGMIMNPSGIYTLVEGKTHDTLYERMTEITGQNVKIPDPFVKTGFI